MKRALRGIVAGALVSASGFANAVGGGNAGVLDDLSVDVRLGVSPFLGVLAVELQSGHYALGLGLPGNVAFTYYRNPGADSPFYSAGIGHISDDEFNDYEGGEFYDTRKSDYLSLGGGYRWQWLSGWNVTTYAALQYVQAEYESRGRFFEQRLEKQSVNLALGLMVGYVF